MPRRHSPPRAREYITPFVGQNALPMMDVIDKMREERTGVSAVTQGLDPSALADSTNLVATQIMSAAQQRIKMIARIFAETGFRWLSLHIHSLILKNEDNKKIADLGDGFVEVDPRSWRKRRDMVAKVGIGNAEKKEKIISLERILNLQKDIFAAQGGSEGPLLNSTNVYNALQDLQKEVNLDTRDRYFSNPADFQPPPPPENPTSEALEIAEAEVTLRATKDAAEHDLDVEKFKVETAQNQEQIDIQKAELILKAENAQQERELKAMFKIFDTQGG